MTARGRSPPRPKHRPDRPERSLSARPVQIRTECAAWVRSHLAHSTAPERPAPSILSTPHVSSQALPPNGRPRSNLSTPQVWSQPCPPPAGRPFILSTPHVWSQAPGWTAPSARSLRFSTTSARDESCVGRIKRSRWFGSGSVRCAREAIRRGAMGSSYAKCGKGRPNLEAPRERKRDTHTQSTLGPTCGVQAARRRRWPGRATRTSARRSS